MSESIAREGDWKMLNERLKNAKSGNERRKINEKMDFIRREAEDPKMAQLRKDLVGAARQGDSEAGDRISEEIYNYQKMKGWK